jgi:branched-chain amino acid aminotransferase
MSKHQALNSGYDDALMLDSNGDVAEATGANIFLIFNGELHTPIPDCFLDGITRRTVMELAENKGIKVVERKITTAELSQASEVFLTGTAAEITPVKSIDDHTFSLTDITRGLQQDYQDLVYGRN